MYYHSFVLFLSPLVSLPYRPPVSHSPPLPPARSPSIFLSSFSFHLSLHSPRLVPKPGGAGRLHGSGPQQWRSPEEPGLDARGWQCKCLCVSWGCVSMHTNIWKCWMHCTPDIDSSSLLKPGAYITHNASWSQTDKLAVFKPNNLSDFTKGFIHVFPLMQ